MDQSNQGEGKSVIVVGASADRQRFSNKAVRVYQELGYTVFPVHPREKEVEGLSAHSSIGEVPGTAELLLLYVRPEVGLKLISEAPGRGVTRVFLNPGTASPELAARIGELGMEPIEACAIVAVGKSPADYPD